MSSLATSAANSVGDCKFVLLPSSRSNWTIHSSVVLRFLICSERSRAARYKQDRELDSGHGALMIGFLNINKSSGMTSHDVVNRVRKTLKVKHIGHGGTLDP